MGIDNIEELTEGQVAARESHDDERQETERDAQRREHSERLGHDLRDIDPDERLDAPAN